MYLETGASAGDTDSQGGSVADVGVVALGEERYELGALLGLLEEQEAERYDGSTTYIVGDVAHGNVKQSSNGGIVGRAAVRQRDGVHGAIPQNGILAKRRHMSYRPSMSKGRRVRRYLVESELFNERVRLLLATAHDQGDTDGKTADDLLVLGVMSIRKHIL